MNKAKRGYIGKERVWRQADPTGKSPRLEKNRGRRHICTCARIHALLLLHAVCIYMTHSFFRAAAAIWDIDFGAAACIYRVPR